MTRRRLRTWLLAAAALGALAGALASVLPGLAAGPSSGGRPAARSARVIASAAARGPRGPRGRRGPRGPRGFAASDVVRAFTVNWRASQFGGRDRAYATVPSVGTLTAVCNPGQQALVLDSAPPPGMRALATVTTFQGEGTAAAANQRLPADPGSGRIVIPLPNNAVVEVVLSMEPQSGDGGPGPSPATVMASSEWKLNDPNPANDFCFVAGQALQNG